MLEDWFWDRVYAIEDHMPAWLYVSFYFAVLYPLGIIAGALVAAMLLSPIAVLIGWVLDH